jgi:lysyl-tRNA synthetase, class II
VAVARWKWRTAGVVASVVQVAAVASLLLFVVDEESDLAEGVLGAAYLLGLPVEANLFIALVLVVLGAALRRRKRSALWTLLLFEALNVTSLLLFLLFYWIDPFPFLGSDESPDPAGLAVDLSGGVAVGLALIVLLLVVRDAFPAKLAPGAWRQALVVGVTGIVGWWLVGWGLTELFPGHLHGTWHKLVWAANQSIGEVLPQRRGGEGPDWLGVLLGFGGMLVAIAALYVFFRGERSSRWLDDAEELSVRRLLAAHGEPDSLGYFATRRDKSAVFAPNGRAALTYRVLAGTSLPAATRSATRRRGRRPCRRGWPRHGGTAGCPACWARANAARTCTRRPA